MEGPRSQSQSQFQRPRTVAEDVYRFLRRELLSGSYPGGSWLREQELARSLNVSRTPVREAIRQLAQEGLLVIEANRGVRVHEPDLAEATATYEVRERLEGMAARLAAKRQRADTKDRLEARLEAMLAAPRDDYARHIEADDDFHRTVAELSGNPVLFELIERLTSRVNRVKVLTRQVNATDLAHAQHEGIVAAIVAADGGLAEARMAEHIRTNLGFVMARLESEAPPERPREARLPGSAPEGES